MKKHVKNTLLLLTLLMVLILSISATFAQEVDNSTSDLAVFNDDDSISMDNQDIGYEDVSSVDDEIIADTVSTVDDNYATDALSAANNEEKLNADETVEPMPQVDTGVVSGGVDYIATNPGVSSGNLAYTVPENMTNLKSAIVIVNIYSGSGAGGYALYSNVTLNTKNGLEELGYETLWLDKDCANDPNVYAINDHTTKQYSDYQMVYNITNKVNTLTSGDSITINVANSEYPGKLFDGRIKLISLLFAFDDGDNDKYTYWLNAGQLWTADTESFDFNTQDYAGKTTDISLRTIALSSSLASSYKINNMEASYDSSSSGGLTYKDIKWDNIGPKFNAGTKTNFWAQNGGGSYKTNVALLIASEPKTEEPLTEVYVDYANGDDSYMGTTLSTAFKTLAHALSVVEPNGIININGLNYLDDVDVNGLTVNKNISFIGLGNDATIDAKDAGRIFYITSEAVSLSNLALVNANVASASDKRGGALWVQGTTLTVENCKFINNTAGASSSYGGAINLKSTSATIKDSLFENNSAFYTGAGINAENSNILLNISNCIFTLNEILNTGWATGGAICSYNTVIIDKSAFYGNKLAEGKNGRSINQYGTGSLTITNSILLDGANSVYIASGPTTLENNWWGNNDTTAETNPKDLGYTNANVGSYLYLNMTGYASGMDVGDTASININLASTGDETVNLMNLPATLTAVNGNIAPTETELVNGAGTATYTITTAGDNSITVHVLGIEDTLALSSGDVISTEVIYVNATGGSDSNSGISWDSAFQTIEKAISTVDDNGVIYVADGFYQLADSTSANGISITKNIAIIGQSVNAVISGGNTKRIFTIGVGHTLNITNLTLTEGKSSSYGGAIQIEDGGNTNPITQGYLIISDSIISNCNANYGGAIGTNRGNINNINNVTFISNSASVGGAIASQQKGTVTIGDDCKFINSTSNGRGSVIYAAGKVTTGKNNFYYGNLATGNYGYGAIFGYGFEIGPANVFINNRATNGGALYLGGNSYTGSGSYCIFINNTDNNGRPIGKQSANRQLTLNNCYWGTNEPNFSTLSNGGISASTYLVLGISSDLSTIRVGDTATITVDLTKNQNGATVDINSLPAVLPLMFTVENGNVNPVETELVNGIGTTTYSPAIMGEASITANIYAPLETLTLNIGAEAGTVFVNYTGGLDSNDGNGWDTAVKTLSHALEIVGEGKTIYIADGVNYLDDVSADGLTINKNLSIVGMGDNVVIDANNNGRIFNIGAYTVDLSNLVFINGNSSTATDKRGGALYVNGATLTIDNCKFINNTAGNKEDAGGSSTYGGAINLKSSTTTITNSEFDGNTAWSTGAGINAENSNVLLNISDSTFINNVILNNGWSAGVAICSYNTVIINRSVFYGNRLTDESRNGKSINQYGTGSLTIENSILLDGEKGVWIATGPATLENNWWGNNNANAESNPKDLGYTNADVESYMVLSSIIVPPSSTNPDKVFKDDLVTVITTLNGNVIELPITLSANVGTITPNETVITASEESSYEASTVGDVELTVDVLGIQNVISFTVKEKLPNVEITNVKTPWSDGINPGLNNTFTITLNNNEASAVEGLVLEVYSNETGELIASYNIESLIDGSSSIAVTDPTIRPITEDTIMPAAQDNKIRFTFNLMRGDDIAATLSVDKILAYSGYLNKTYAYGGHDNVINRNYTISGDLIIATIDVSEYAPQDTMFKNFTWSADSIATPEGAEIVKVLLYFNYNWDQPSYFPNNWELTFNDVDILNEYLSHETDRANRGIYSAHEYGLVVYDVSNYFKVNEGNSLVINKSNRCALYPPTLFILYNMTGSTTEKDIYFSDICDVYLPLYVEGYEDLLRTVVYYNDINTTDLKEATWYVFSGSSSSNNNISFNDGIAVNPFNGYTSDDCRPYAYNVTGLIGNNNEAWFIAGSQSSTTVAYEQVLVVERTTIMETNITVANESVTLLVGDEFDIEAVLTPNVGELTYTSSDENIATVENGKITAIAPGTAIITVAFAGNEHYAPSTATVTVNVKTETVYVNYTGGSDTNDGSSWDTAVKTLSHALEIVSKGTIYVAEGVHYLDGATVNGLSINQDLSIIGVGDNVVLDANNVGRIFYIDGAAVNLSNLIFANANVSTATDKRGGAIWARDAILNIENCKFINNTAGNSSSYGGAVNLKASTATISDSHFEENSAYYTGAAINAENGNILLNISNTTFINNMATNTASTWANGGGICAYGTLIVNRSTFYGNKAQSGKSIHKYDGSLIVTNSILLDGEKSINLKTPSEGTLENNWWGNNDATAESNPKDLGYTNADVESYFVLSSSINQDKVFQGDSVTVTSTLTCNVIELPIVLSANIGTITPRETIITDSEVSTYDATDMGDVEITVDVLGVQNVISFTVKEKLPNVAITDVSTPWNLGIFAAVNNTFTITLNNNEESAVEGLVLEVYSNETRGLIAVYNIESLIDGSSSISVTDPTIRSITEETIWPAAQDNKIKFTFNLMRGEDLVSTLSVDKALAYDGYLNKTYAYDGHDNIINRNYTISGDIIIATQDVSSYAGSSVMFRNETWDIDSIATPEGAEIVKVFLYFHYNSDKSYFPDGWNLTFNDVEILNDYISHEKDRSNLGSYGVYEYGLLVFDVTDYFKVNEINSFVINKTGSCALYPSTLFVLYNMTGSDSVKDVYFSDICDVFLPRYNMDGYDDMLKTVVNYNDINVEDLADAAWYVFAGSSSSNNNLTFNDGLEVDAFNGYTSNDTRPYVYNVTGFIGNNNEAWFITGTQSTTTVAYEQVLVVERMKNKTSITVANETVDLTVNDEFDIGAVLTPDVGELTYTSSDESIAIVEDGKIIAKASGTAVITVAFAGNENYAPSNATVSVTVNKKTTDISVNVVPAQEYYPGIVTVIVQSNVDGVYNVGIDESSIDVTVENGIGYETFYAIDAGKHNATVKFAGNEIYDEATVQKEFEIFKELIPEFSVEFSDATYPEDVNVLINGPSGTYTVKVDDEHTIEITVDQDNIGTGNISGLAAGTYTDVNVTFGGNDNVEAGSHLFKFIVQKSDEKENISDIIEINTRTPENSTDTVFSISLPENATGYLLVDIDGKHYYAPVENGTATVSVPELAPGNYTATVTYSGDDEYASVTKETGISVPSNVPDNALSIPETSESSSPTYSVKLPEDATGYLVVDVDGTKYVAALNKGSASVTVPGLSEGKHNVTVTYTGDGKYSSVSKSTTLNVHIPVYKITNNKNVAAIYSANAYYKVRITKDGKAVGAGESVTITFNGKKKTVKTDKNGYASFKINTKVKVKKYTITAEYKGVKVSNKVTIKHVIKAYNKKVKKSKKVTKVKVSLKKVNGKYLKAKKLKIKFRGKTYKVKTNKKGIATWKVKKSMLKKLKVGKKYKYKVTYGKDIVTKKLTIKK